MFFAKKAASSTIFTFFTNYEIKHLSCGDECNFNKVGPCCILMCQMTTSYSKYSWSKGPSSGVWTTFSNAYNSTWWPCTYKGNFPSMLTKTITKDINFHAPYFQLVIINTQWIENMVNLWLTYNDMWIFFVKMSKVCSKTPLE